MSMLDEESNPNTLLAHIFIFTNESVDVKNGVCHFGTKYINLWLLITEIYELKKTIGITHLPLLKKNVIVLELGTYFYLRKNCGFLTLRRLLVNY